MQEKDYYKLYQQAQTLNIIFSKMIDALQVKRVQEGHLSEMIVPSVAIYGTAKVAKKLWLFLTSNGVTVKYAMDQKKQISEWNGVKVYHPGDNIPEKTDLIIITSEFYYDEIIRELEKNNINNFTSINCFMDEIIKAGVDYRD